MIGVGLGRREEEYRFRGLRSHEGSVFVCPPVIKNRCTRKTLRQRRYHDYCPGMSVHEDVTALNRNDKFSCGELLLEVKELHNTIL